ncbi:hypothetical protein [Streptomyces sp. NPDC053069]|uniref:hypothetical protein n=1 Tax=Streptomyces sp. NPDC053069 TaxID=3365695 RepID=UPI0037D7B74B
MSGCSSHDVDSSGRDPDPVFSTPDPETSTPDPETSTPDLDTTPPETEETEPQWSVPEKVVGVWCGGANDQPDGHWTYAFTDEGEVVAANERIGFRGHVVTEGNIMTFYVKGSRPVQSTWSVGYEEALGMNLLYLDGYSYVPGRCDS